MMFCNIQYIYKSTFKYVNQALDCNNSHWISESQKKIFACTVSVLRLAVYSILHFWRKVAELLNVMHLCKGIRINIQKYRNSDPC